MSENASPADTQTGWGIRRRKTKIKPIRRGFIGHVFYSMGMFVSRLTIDFELKGLERLPLSGPYILAANHETYVDGMWILSCLPRPIFKNFCCIGAQDLLTKYGPFGRIIMHVGRGIPINRSGSPIGALAAAADALNQGNVLLIHPEGTRSRNGRLGRIQEGACYLSKKVSVPLIPVFLDGGYEIFNRYMKTPRLCNPKTGQKNKLIINFGMPMQPNNYKNIKAMNAALSDWMHGQFERKEVPRDYDEKLLIPYKK